MSYDPQMDPDEDVPPGKVKLTCHSCGARYLVPEGKVRGRRFRASCKRCGGIIVARYDKGSFTVLPDSGGDNRRAKRPSAALRLQSADLAEDRGDDGWYIVIAGEPRGPFTPDQINEELAAGRITERNYAWREGEPDWVRLQDIVALASGTSERTGFYASEDAPPLRRDPTSETIAGGPKGRHHNEEEHPDFYGDDPTYGAADVGASDGYDARYDGDGQETYGGHREEEEDDYDGRATGYYDGGAEQGYPAFDDRPEHSAEATRLHDTAQRQDLPIRPARTGEVRDPDRWSREVDVKAWGGHPGKIQGEQVGHAGRYAQSPERAVEEPWPDDMSEPRLWASPRRPAALPAPPGARRAVIPAPSPPPPPGLPPSSDYTRPLSQEEQRHAAVAPGPPAFAGAPAFTPPPARPFAPPSAPLPSPSAFGGSAFGASRPVQPENSDLLPSLVPAVPASSMAPPKLLLPTQEPFWSVGKIVLATAIGSALLICLTVGIVAFALKSRRGPKVATRLPSTVQRAADPAGEDDDPPKTLATSQAKAAKTAAVAPPTPRPKPKDKVPAVAPTVKPAPTPTPTPTPAPIPDVQIAPTPEPKAARKAAVRKASRRPARRVRRRAYRPRRRTARRSRPKDDVDALIGGGGGGSSADDVLAAAGGSSRKKARRKPKPRPAPAAAADDVLAAAGGGGGGKPRALTRSQIAQVMRRLNSHVQGCFDTHKQPGTLRLKVTIRPSGRATGRTTGSFAGSPTARCIERAVPRLRFPSISGPTTRITYPFTLK